MLYYLKKSKNATETQKKISAVYEEGAVTDGIYRKLFVRLHAGDFSLDNAPMSDRPVAADSHEIETLTENNQHYTLQEITNILKIS